MRSPSAVISPPPPLSHPGAAIDCGMADGPDVALVRQAVEKFPNKPVICEGRVHTLPMPSCHGCRRVGCRGRHRHHAPH